MDSVRFYGFICYDCVCYVLNNISHEAVLWPRFICGFSFIYHHFKLSKMLVIKNTPIPLLAGLECYELKKLNKKAASKNPRRRFSIQ